MPVYCIRVYLTLIIGLRSFTMFADFMQHRHLCLYAILQVLRCFCRQGVVNTNTLCSTTRDVASPRPGSFN